MPELRDVNCLQNDSSINAGDILLVPRLPETPVGTSTPFPSRNVRPVGCTNPRIRIVGPLPLERVTGVITLIGSADAPDFWYYRIEVRPDPVPEYEFYSYSTIPVPNRALAILNTDFFDNGLHWIKLTVVNTDGEVAPDATCDIPLIFE